MKNPYLKLQGIEYKSFRKNSTLRYQDYRSVWNKEMFPCVQHQKLPGPS